MTPGFRVLTPANGYCAHEKLWFRSIELRPCYYSPLLMNWDLVMLDFLDFIEKLLVEGSFSITGFLESGSRQVPALEDKIFVAGQVIFALVSDKSHS